MWMSNEKKSAKLILLSQTFRIEFFSEVDMYLLVKRASNVE